MDLGLAGLTPYGAPEYKKQKLLSLQPRDHSMANWATGATWPSTTVCYRIYIVERRICGETNIKIEAQRIAVISMTNIFAEYRIVLS